MNGELSRRLRLGAPHVVFPPTPDLADAVVGRLERAPQLPARRAPRTVIALACAAAIGAAVLGVSERARSAVVGVFDLVPGVVVTRTAELPQRTALLRASEDFGRPTSLEKARRDADFALRLPDRLPRPDVVYVDYVAGSSAITALYGADTRRAAIVLTQWHPAVLLFRKLLRSPDTLVTAVPVDGVQGLWIAGADHEVFYLGVDRRHHRGAPSLAGAALVWHREGVTFRVEGDLTLDDALALAGSLK